MSSKLRDLGLVMAEKRNIRKCLFGRPDAEQRAREIQAQKEMCDAEAKKCMDKWGFDPIKGEPVSGGTYVCTPVSKHESIPAFYLKGYSPRKTRRNFSRSRPEFCSRPLSAKRKLNLGDACLDEPVVNDENRIVADNRVPNNGDIVYETQSQFIPDTMDCRSTSRLCDSTDDSCGLQVSNSSPSSIPELSPLPRNQDNITPPANSIVTQSSILDYLAVKKQRVLPSKALPRT